MERRIRRLGIFMVLCFLALFIQLNNIQVLKANSLANNPSNPGVLAVERSQPRGSILSSDGVILASSVARQQRRLQVPPGLQPRHGHPLLADRRLRLTHLRPDRRGVHLQQLPRVPHPAGPLAPGPARQSYDDRQRHPHHQFAVAIEGGSPGRRHRRRRHRPARGGGRHQREDRRHRSHVRPADL